MSLNRTTHNLIRDARDALMRGKPNVEDALAFLDRAEAEEIAGRRANDHHWKIDAIDHARRELTAKPPRPHHALALLDNIAGRPRAPMTHRATQTGVQ